MTSESPERSTTARSKWIVGIRTIAASITARAATTAAARATLRRHSSTYAATSYFFRHPWALGVPLFLTAIFVYDDISQPTDQKNLWLRSQQKAGRFHGSESCVG